MAERFDQTVEHSLRMFRAERVHENLTRIIQAALGNVRAGNRHFVKLFENGVDVFFLDGFDASHLSAKQLDFVVIQLLQKLRAYLFAQDDKESGGFPNALQSFLVVVFRQALASLFLQPSAQDVRHGRGIFFCLLGDVLRKGFGLLRGDFRKA